MRRRHVELALWAVAAVLSGIGVLGWRRASGAPVTAATRGAVVAPAVPEPFGAAADRAAAATVAADPFRATRRPSGVAFLAQGEAAPTAPRPPRPQLAMTGSIGGPPWSSILEGVPGREGSVIVSAGDTLGGLRIRSVRRDSVVVQGADTTWRLGVRKPWQ